jgi:N-dimethylarginine dimethylaminohydrolase
MMGGQTNPRILMCRPEHFGVVYAINPWMDPDEWERDEEALAVASQVEWIGLRNALRDLGAQIELVPAATGLPDLVFTANAAVVLDRRALLARFRYPERQPEESHFAAVFRSLRARGVIDEFETIPDDMVLEGAGDCVFDRTRNLFWMGYGPRSDAAAAKVVENTFGVEVVPLELADPRFYHLDTALCPLSGGDVMHVPGAFTAKGRDTIAARTPASQRIEIAESDAAQLAANAVSIGDVVLMSGCSESLRAQLGDRGYRVLTKPLNSFLRSGGSAFCLTLRLDLTSADASLRLREGRCAVTTVSLR